MKIETLEHVEITKIKPYEKNYQSHELNREHIKNSIEDFNFDVPIVVDPDYVIVKGHGRYEALKELNHKTIPLVIVNHTLDTPEKAAAARIADNESSRAAQIDNDILKGELLDIGDFFDMGDYGLIDIMGEDEEDETTGDDEVPEAVPAITVKGDLYELGEHRVMCGDSTMIDDVDKLMDGEKADMVFTDPPYGVNYEGGHFHSGNVNITRKREKLKNDQSSNIYTDVIPILASICDGPCYTWFADTKPIDLYSAVNKIGKIHSLIIWHKVNAKYAAMNAQYKQRHEPCLYWKPKGSTLRWCGATTEATIWEMKRDAKNDFHPTQKPTELAERAINNHKVKSCLDLFLGSGSTLIACEKTNRKCYGMELDEKYCDVIVKRYVDFCKKNNKKYTVKRNGAVCSDFNE